MKIQGDAIECASLPPGALAALAALRREPGVTVSLAGDRAWVRWDAASDAVLTRLLPVAGVELYARRDGLWFRPGAALPAFALPVDRADPLPLHHALTPAPVRPLDPPEPAVSPVSVTLRLARDDRPRPASALLCDLDALARWAELAPTGRLAALKGARSGARVLVFGQPLPPLAGAARFWGERVLTPLGLRPEPDLPESALRDALGVREGECLVLTDGGAEAVPLDAFRPLTRAGVRLARGDRPA